MELRRVYDLVGDHADQTLQSRVDRRRRDQPDEFHRNGGHPRLHPRLHGRAVLGQPGRLPPAFGDVQHQRRLDAVAHPALRRRPARADLAGLRVVQRAEAAGRPSAHAGDAPPGPRPDRTEDAAEGHADQRRVVRQDDRRRILDQISIHLTLEPDLKSIAASRPSMTRLASFIISWTISAAGLICRTSPALSPEGRHISSKAPIVSGVGSIAENFGIGYSCPPNKVRPMNWGGSGAGGVWSSCPSHSLTTRLRMTLIG